MDIYGPIFRSVVFPLWESWVRHRPVLDYMRELQTRSLSQLLVHAHKNVPFYRDRFAAAGITPADIRSVDDLAKLPILRRVELRGIDRLSVTAPPSTICKQTSGTTGEPLVFGY